MKQKCTGMRCLAFLAFFAICTLGIAQMPNGFPTMPNTGNPSADAQAYDLAKQQWLELNPSQQVNVSPAVVVPHTEIENQAYELQKSQAVAAPAVSAVEQAAVQLRALRMAFETNGTEWSTSNVRVYQAYIDAFTMARGNAIVSIPAVDYATFFPELKALVDNNTALFNITQ